MPPETYKVKVFKPEWLENYLDGIQVKTWLTGDLTTPNRARCMACPAPVNSLSGFVTFSIAEGFSAIKTHSRTLALKHLKAEEEKDQNRNQIPPAKQMRIEQGLQNQDEINKVHRKKEENILKRTNIAEQHASFSWDSESFVHLLCKTGSEDVPG